jgi:hypothetical protein
VSAAVDLARTALVAATVSAVALGVYDVNVRQPRTPRIAVVDIAKLFAAAEMRAKDGAISARSRQRPGSAAAAGGSTPGAAEAVDAGELAGLQAAGTFGPNVEKVLTDLSDECHCAIVAMAAVIGGSAAVPDYTAEAARRLGVTLASGYGR